MAVTSATPIYVDIVSLSDFIILLKKPTTEAAKSGHSDAQPKWQNHPFMKAEVRVGQTFCLKKKNLTVNKGKEVTALSMCIT